MTREVEGFVIFCLSGPECFVYFQPASRFVRKQKLSVRHYVFWTNTICAEVSGFLFADVRAYSVLIVHSKQLINTDVRLADLKISACLFVFLKFCQAD